MGKNNASHNASQEPQMRLGWSIPLPGPFRLSGTVWRSKRRRRQPRRAYWDAPPRPVYREEAPPPRIVYQAALPGWECPHNHSREGLAVECAQREARRRGLTAKPPVKR